MELRMERRWWWVVTGCVMINGYFTYGIIYSFGVLFGEIQDEFGSSTVLTGWMQSVCLCSTNLFAVPGQLLSVRFGYFYVISSSMFLYTLSLLLSSFAPSVIYLYITYGLGVGLSTAFITKPGIQLIFEWAPIHYRARASTLGTFGATVGLLTVSPLLEMLVTQFGWRWSLGISSGFVFAVGLVTAPLLFLTEKKQNKISKKKNKINNAKETAAIKEEVYSDVSQRGIFCLPEMWLYALMAILASCAQGFTTVNLVDFSTKSDFSLRQGALILSILGGSEVIGKLVFAVFVDRFAYHKILIWPHACIVSAVCCISLQYVKSFEGFLAISTVLGFLKAIFNCSPYVVSSELLTSRYQTSIASLGCVPAGIGFLFTALVGGFSYDLTGSYNSALYACSVMFLLAALCAICALLWQKMCAMERFQRKPGEKIQEKPKDCYTKLNVIEDKLQSTNATQV